MWWVDLVILADGLEAWTRTDENIARLVDREDYWLNSEYSSWIADPDDDEARRERQRRKAAGIKPPPQPILFPVGLRPPQVYDELVEAAHTQAKLAEGTPTRKKVTIAALRSMMKRQSQ